MAEVACKETLAYWVSLALRKALTEKNIKSGFRAVGIFPLDRGAILRHLKPSIMYSHEPQQPHGDLLPLGSQALLSSTTEGAMDDEQATEEAIDGGEEGCFESQEIAIDLASEQATEAMHFFVHADPTDPDVPDDIGIVDPDVECLNSITRFLTLSTMTPRVSYKHRDPIIDFTKSIMLTSDEYMQAATELCQSKIDAAKEKERLQIEKEERQKQKAVEREEEKLERQARAAELAEVREAKKCEQEEARIQREEA